jgi:hypothetical protein
VSDLLAKNGDEVRDTVTGFAGTVTRTTEEWQGSTWMLVTSSQLSEGKPVEFVFPAERLLVTKEYVEDEA